MAKGVDTSNIYSDNHSDKTLKGMMTPKEDVRGPQGPLITVFNKYSEGKNGT
jgi:hypothetical protein